MTPPRSLELRTADPIATVYQRIMEWARDVATSIKAMPTITYVTVSVPASGALAGVSAAGRIRSVVVARVDEGTVSGAPGLYWVPASGGFDVVALYGVTGAARVTLRVEVL